MLNWLNWQGHIVNHARRHKNCERTAKDMIYLTVVIYALVKQEVMDTPDLMVSISRTLIHLQYS